MLQYKITIAIKQNYYSKCESVATKVQLGATGLPPPRLSVWSSRIYEFSPPY